MMKQIDDDDVPIATVVKKTEASVHDHESQPMIQVQESLAPKMDGASNKPKYQDVPFAIGFLINFLVIFGLFVSNPIAIGQLTQVPTTRPQGEKQLELDFPLSTGSIVCTVFFSLGMSSVWLKMLLKYTNSMIRISLMMNIGIFLFMGCTSLLVNPILGIFCLLGAFLAYRYMRSVENRIAFATANVKIACAALSQYKSVFFLAYALILVQIVWFLLWSAALGSVGMMFQLNANQREPCKEWTTPNGNVITTCDKSSKAGGGFGVAFFFLLLSVYWGQQVVHNVSTCTIAGTVASWWYQHDSMASSVVSKSLGRSLTTSFGSICFGALLVALVQALRTMAEMKQREARSNRNNNDSAAADMVVLALACLASCILTMLENFLEYFNAWAYTYVGIYGMDFRTSGKSVIELFKARGWTAIVNDDLTASALSLGAFVMGLLCGVLGLVIAALGDGQKYGAVAFVGLGMTGFVTGMCMALILANVVTAALRTVFVCFAEDPNALSNCHPEHHKELMGAWREFHGDAFMTSFQNQAV